MFAAQFSRLGPPDVLTTGPYPEPHAGPGRIRVRTRAAGISPVDLALRAGRSPSSERLALPHIPGVDAAGVVDEVGPGVTGVSAGDEVFGTVDIAGLGGASAQYAVLAFWATRPPSMPWDQAGAAGTSIETATRALDLFGDLTGATLLIDGAAGGVGSVAVQLAAARGARVIGTGSAANRDFITGLGAVATTYGEGLPARAAALGRITHALDVAGQGSLPELIAITGSVGAVVTIADFTAAQHGVRLSVGEFGGQPHGRHGLAAAAALAEQGRFRVPIRQAFDLDRAADAHALAETGPHRGKVVLIVA